jgi:hypothetical protein
MNQEWLELKWGCTKDHKMATVRGTHCIPPHNSNQYPLPHSVIPFYDKHDIFLYDILWCLIWIVLYSSLLTSSMWICITTVLWLTHFWADLRWSSVNLLFTLCLQFYFHLKPINLTWRRLLFTLNEEDISTHEEMKTLLLSSCKEEVYLQASLLLLSFFLLLLIILHYFIWLY